MRSKLNIFALLIIFLSFPLITFSQSPIEDALKKAKLENKKIIIDVYTDWCGWCKKMDAEAYSDPDIKDMISENFILVKLDAEGKNKLTYNGKQYTEEEISYYFDVFSFPTTIFLEPDGKLIEFTYDKIKMKNIPGYFKTSEFKKILKFFRDEKYKDSDLSAVV